MAHDTVLRPWDGACDLPSGQPLGRPSTYDASYASFKLTVNVQDDASFCLKQYTIASGPMKGCRALVLVPAGAFRLLDLPVELRHMIYSFLVTQDEPIKLKRYQSRLVQQSFTHGTAKSTGWNAETKKWDTREKHLLGVSGINKQIHEEAAEIMYGTNRFEFEDPQTFSLLSKLSGAGMQHLRHIKLGAPTGNKSKHLSAALNLLKKCTSLRELRLPHEAICDTVGEYRRHNQPESMSAEALAEACAPMLFALEKAHQQTRFTHSVLDVIVGMQCDCVFCEMWKKNSSAYQPHCNCKTHAEWEKVEIKFWKDFKHITGMRLSGRVKLTKSGLMHKTLDSMWASAEKKKERHDEAVQH